jgi:putative ABC transport system substrate-binding protein
VSKASANLCGLFACLAIGAATALSPAIADPSAIPRVGVLVRPLANAPYETGLRDGLRELGYIEGRSIFIEWRRSAGGDEDRSLSADLARSKFDVVVVFSTPGALAAMEASPTVPIVFLSGDPVATGLAASLARPGGNATGVTGVLTELTGKRMELLRQLAPRVRRIACLVNPTNPSGVLQFEAAKTAARALGVQLTKLEVRNSAELDAALHKLPRGTRSGLFVTADGLFLVNKAKIAWAVREARLPATFPYRDYHDDGVLMSYGLNPLEVGRKMAGYVDKVLKGAKPGDLPIEQISKYELIIDLRVAHELGLDVPQTLLLQADQVIK